jgi:UDP-glucose 4-epimerase
MKKKKILVTGGSGFIGSTLIKNLINSGYKVNCLDLKRPDFPASNNFKFFKGSVNDKEIVKKSISNCKTIIHLAASLGVQHTDSNIVECLDLNIYGTRNLLEIAQKIKVDKFIFISSSEVYGEQKKFPINENSELKNKSIYATSKIVAEQYVRGFYQKFKLKFNIIRFFNIYGPGQKDNFVMSKFRKQIKSKKPLTVFGNGNQIRSFCNVTDAATGLIQVLEKGKTNTTYNVGNNNEPISMYSLAKKFVKIANKNIKIKKVSYNKSDRNKSREIFKRYPDLQRIFKDTKYRPKIDLSAGIKELIDLK